MVVDVVFVPFLITICDCFRKDLGRTTDGWGALRCARSALLLWPIDWMYVDCFHRCFDDDGRGFCCFFFLDRMY